MAMNVKFLRGSYSGYQALATKDANTLYFCEDGKLFLGTNLIAEINDTDPSKVNELIAEALKAYYTKTEIDALLKTINDKNDAQDKALSDYKTEMVETLKGYQTVIPAETYDAYGSAAQALEDAKTYTNDEIIGLEFALSEDGKTLELKNKAGTAVATLNTTDFVVDGMLSSVVADQENNKLTFTWNTDSGIQVTEIELSSIADIYKGSEGTEIKVAVSNENVISATLTDTVKADIAKGVDAQGRVATLEGKVDVEKVSTAIATATADMATNAGVDAKLANYVTTAAHEAFVSGNAVLQSGITADKVANYDEVKSTVDTNKATWDKAGTALQAADLADYAKTADVNSAIATATTDMATKTHVADNYVAKEGYVAFTSEEKTKLASLENYDDTELAGRVGVVEAKPAMNITAEQITAWDGEVGAKELAGQKATLAEVKEAYIGDTNAKLVDVVKAVNMLAEGSEATDKAVETVTTNVKDIAAQLTWGTF